MSNIYKMRTKIIKATIYIDLLPFSLCQLLLIRDAMNTSDFSLRKEITANLILQIRGMNFQKEISTYRFHMFATCTNSLSRPKLLDDTSETIYTLNLVFFYKFRSERYLFSK